MIDREYFIKYQMINLCEALHRNINDNFESISFVVLKSGDIQIKIVLNNLTPYEEDLIEDISVEFSAKQERDCVLKPLVVVGNNDMTLTNVVYRKRQ